MGIFDVYNVYVMFVFPSSFQVKGGKCGIQWGTHDVCFGTCSTNQFFSFLAAIHSTGKEAIVRV